MRMFKILLVHLLLTVGMQAADLFDFDIGMSKSQLLDEVLSEESEALFSADENMIRLSVLDSQKYHKNYFDGAIEYIYFHFDQDGELYKIRLQSSDRDRTKYMNYEYLYNSLSEKLEKVHTQRLVTDTYVIRDTASEENFTSYNLELFDEASQKEYAAFLKAKQEQIRLAEERLNSALANL